jgi:hypothetical protein
MYGAPRDVSKFQVFGCRAWVYLNSERRDKGKHTPRAVEAINLGFEPNTSAYSIYIPEKNTIMSSNQAKFDELAYPYRKQKNVEQLQSDNSTNILFGTSKDAKWVQYNPMKCNKYVRVHFDASSGNMIMRVDDVPNTFTRVNQHQYLLDMVAMAKRETEQHQANIAEISHHALKGLPISINPDRPPRNLKDAMSRIDKQEWAAGYDKEYQGFFERQAFKMVPAPPGVKIHDTLTRLEY